MTRSGDEPVNPVARWVVWASFALSLIGVGISGYLTFTHYAGTQFLACSDAGVVNCGAVTTSAQSVVAGVPVAVLGLVAYLGLAVLNSPWGWARASRWVAWTRVLGVGVAMAFVLWLVAAELLIIDHICLWCTGVHVTTFALSVIISWAAPGQLARKTS